MYTVMGMHGIILDAHVILTAGVLRLKVVTLSSILLFCQGWRQSLSIKKYLVTASYICNVYCNIPMQGMHMSALGSRDQSFTPAKIIVMIGKVKQQAMC